MGRTTKNKKSDLFKTSKQIKADIKDSVMESAVALIGGVGANLGYSQLKKHLPEKTQKFAGVIVAGVGTAGNIVSNNALISALSNGLTGASGALIIEDLASPKMKTRLGLGAVSDGIDYEKITDEDLKNLEADMLKEYNEEANEIQGIENEEDDMQMNADDQDFDDDFTEDDEED